MEGAPLPFAEDAFDVVWAGEVLEHVADVVGLLAEVRRVLRWGGTLLVTTPWHGRLVVAADAPLRPPRRPPALLQRAHAARGARATRASPSVDIRAARLRSRALHARRALTAAYCRPLACR